MDYKVVFQFYYGQFLVTCQDEGGDGDKDDPGNADDGRHTQDDVEGAVDRERG